MESETSSRGVSTRGSRLDQARVAEMTLDTLKDGADRDTELQLKGNDALVGSQGRDGPATVVAQD
jgi:hypothetical protein